MMAVYMELVVVITSVITFLLMESIMIGFIIQF